MPASEQTRYDIKRLHRIFAVASLALLAATIWMFLDDHYRPWKPFQRKSNEIELQIAQWRLDQLSSESALAELEQLRQELEQARREPLDKELLNQFCQIAEQAAEHTNDNEIADAARRIRRAVADSGELPETGPGDSESMRLEREAIQQEMEDLIRLVQFREKRQQTQRRSVMADLDAAQARVRLAIRDDVPPEKLESYRAAVDRLADSLEQVTAEHGQVAEDHRALLEIAKELTAKETHVSNRIQQLQAEPKHLAAIIADRRSSYFQDGGKAPWPGKKFLELPLLDAFNSPLRIETLWSEGLMQDFNSREVRRFDRCTTCHHNIDKELPAGALGDFEVLEFALAARENEKSDGHGGENEDPRAGLEGTTDDLDRVLSLYGLGIASAGLIHPDDATIRFVEPDSTAARASVATEATGAMASEEILSRQFTPAAEIPPRPSTGLQMGDVIVAVNGTPVSGPQDAASRLISAWPDPAADTSSSHPTPTISVHRGLPHPYAVHPRQDLFVGSLSPHPKAEFACTVCHGGQGSGTSFEWTSHSPNSVSQREAWRAEYGWFENHDWYYPMLPKRFSQAACLRCHHQVEQLLPSDRFPDPPANKLVEGYRLVREFGCFGCHEINGFEGDRSIGPDLRAESPVAASGLQDFDIREGEMRRLRSPGPSLRHVASKVTPEFLMDWIRHPIRFRPDTRMPQAFGQWRHLDGLQRQNAAEYEAVEVEAMAHYLTTRSQDFNYLPPPASSGEAALGPDPKEDRIARGRILFETSGCLACHKHREFGEAERYRDPEASPQGPDLSGIGDKFDTELGRRWLYTWIKEPTRYDPRTLMPAVSFEQLGGKDGRSDSSADPVDDLVEFLLANSSVGYETPDVAACSDRALDALALEYLLGSFHKNRAHEYLAKGIPDGLRQALKPAELELLVSAEQQEEPDFALSREQKLQYVGRQAIAKNGCFGCHDIPGFESAKPIGPSLTDWGRKDAGQLAFDHVVQYLQSHGARPDASSTESQPADEFYLRQLRSENRIGFLHQKLSEPRSFDYRGVQDKAYNAWLHMPQFAFTAEQREAIMTFVLGLVAQPPTERYICRPDERRQALLDGRAILEKYQCLSCHMVQPQRWKIAVPPGAIDPQRTNPMFPIARHEFTSEQLSASAQVEQDGKLHATLAGLPLLDNRAQPMIFDDYGDELFEGEEYEPEKLEYAFQLWTPAAIDGHAYQVGESPLFIQAGWIEHRIGSEGGFLANYLLPRAFQQERRENSNAKGAQVWSWLPPPLIGQGAKVQAGWMHDYLLDPYPIRPASVLRMPRFNITSDEATRLANYFAALDNVDYPYEFAGSNRPGHLQTAEDSYQAYLASAGLDDATDDTRLDAAMRIATDKNYCVTCHVIGDYDPRTAAREMAPDLSQCFRRLRADYVRRWIAKPTAILPYTGMPINIPYDPQLDHQGGVDQELYHGSSGDQLEALVDLIMNFDSYARQPIAPLVPSVVESAETDAP